MKILFDQGTPVPIRRFLANHIVSTVYELGWNTLEKAEQWLFDILVTTDQNLKYQQNLRGRKIALVVLLSTSWPRLQKAIDRVTLAVYSSVSGSYIEVAV